MKQSRNLCKVLWLNLTVCLQKIGCGSQLLNSQEKAYRLEELDEELAAVVGHHIDRDTTKKYPIVKDHCGKMCRHYFPGGCCMGEL